MEFSSTQTFKPSQNLCSFILPQFKEKGVGVVLNGFYSLDLIFNNKPYFIIKKNIYKVILMENYLLMENYFTKVLF